MPIYKPGAAAIDDGARYRTPAPLGDDNCPEHATPTVTVEPIQWEVLADGKRLGSVITARSGITSRWYAYGTRSQKLGDYYDTQAEAVAAVVAESTKPAPCPTCGAVTA